MWDKSYVKKLLLESKPDTVLSLLTFLYCKIPEIQWLQGNTMINKSWYNKSTFIQRSWQQNRFMIVNKVFQMCSYFPCVVWEMYHVNKPGLACRMRRVTGTDIPGMSVSPVDTSHCTDHTSQMLIPIPLLHRIMNK